MDQEFKCANCLYTVILYMEGSSNLHIENQLKSW